MLVMTESGSGGSRVEVKTGFDNGGDKDDYARQLAEVQTKMDGLIPLGEVAVRGSANRPHVDWLGLLSVRPSLGLLPPSEAAILQTPIPEILEVNSRYN